MGMGKIGRIVYILINSLKGEVLFSMIEKLNFKINLFLDFYIWSPLYIIHIKIITTSSV